MNDIPLTSEWVSRPGWAGPTSHGTLIQLSDRLPLLLVRRDGREASGPFPCPASILTHLLLAPGCGFANDGSLSGREAFGWQLLQKTWACREAISAGDWKAYGKALDQTWEVERQLAPPPAGFDLKYAAARVAGAWGGRPCLAGLLLVVPPSKTSAVRAALNLEDSDGRHLRA